MKLLTKKLKFHSKLTMKVFLVLNLLFGAGIHCAFAQSTVTGRVLDASTGDPLPGVAVIVEGTGGGVTTSTSGSFSINIPSNKTSNLSFSFLGYQTKLIEVAGVARNLEVELEPDNFLVDEVVVVGYGTQAKSDITGSIASVSKARLENIPASDAVQLLQGAIPGLNLMSQSAGSNPDEQTVMLVRGRNSISAENDPLIVVDGMTFYGTLSEISPSDILSIEVLKDASSAAIYGSRAANGVFLITTKSGQKGKTKVTYDGYYSIQNVANFPKLMTVDDYVQYRMMRSNKDYDEDDETTWPLNEAELSVYADGSYNDWSWKKLLVRTGHSQRHSVNISGGSERTTFSVSAYIVDTKGIVLGDKYNKYNTRSRVSTTINSWLKYDATLALTYTDNSGSTPSFNDVFNRSPLLRPFNEDGTVNIYPDASDPKKVNPLENLLYSDQKRNYGANTSHNFTVDIPYVKGLTYKFSFSGQYTASEKYNYMPSNTLKGAEKNGISDMVDQTKYSLLLDNLINYQRDFGKHRLFLTALYSWEEKGNRKIKTEGSNYQDDLLTWNNVQPGLLSKTIENDDQTVLLSQMFRANYSFDSRYMLTFTVRRDGYSGFGKDTKWGVFSSGALAWNIHNEQFFASLKPYINNLKLRFSYGENGNSAFAPYTTIQQMKDSSYVSDGQTQAGYVPKSIGNKRLGWETTRAMNIGLDFGILQNRINGSFDVYRNKTRELLMKQTISSVTGMTSINTNIGKTLNEGIELAINSVNISRKNFSWSTNFNFALTRTKIVDLYGTGEDDIANKWFLGYPIKVNYDYLHTGVWQLGEAHLASTYGGEPGYAKYDDYNNDGKYDSEDKQIIGSPEPNFTSSMTNTFVYKDFSLSILLYGVTGVRKSNPYKDNNYLIQRKWWTEDNPINSFWSVDSNANAYIGGRGGEKPSVYESADYLRIKDITLSYNLPKKWLNKVSLSNLRVYVSMKNPYTFTSWGGLDPELDKQRAIPLQREVLFGLNFSF